jgi:hypothetical protein
MSHRREAHECIPLAAFGVHTSLQISLGGHRVGQGASRTFLQSPFYALFFFIKLKSDICLVRWFLLPLPKVLRKVFCQAAKHSYRSLERNQNQKRNQHQSLPRNPEAVMHRSQGDRC